MLGINIIYIIRICMRRALRSPAVPDRVPQEQGRGETDHELERLHGT